MTTIEDRHRLACILGEPTYEDPTTGYRVMTRPALLSRGHCCGHGCRHCPYPVKDSGPSTQDTAPQTSTQQ